MSTLTGKAILAKKVHYKGFWLYFSRPSPVLSLTRLRILEAVAPRPRIHLAQILRDEPRVQPPVSPNSNQTLGFAWWDGHVGLSLAPAGRQKQNVETETLIYCTGESNIFQSNIF